MAVSFLNGNSFAFIILFFVVHKHDIVYPDTYSYYVENMQS